MRTRHAPSSRHSDPVPRWHATPALRPTGDPVRLAELLHRWEDDRIITPEQAAAMASSVAPTLAVTVAAADIRRQQRSLVVEGLGYLGGAIMLAATMIIASWYWDDLASGWRLAVLGGATLALLAAGAVVPPRMDEAGRRLRAALWFGSTGAFAGFQTILTLDGWELGGADAALLIASCTAAYAAVPWFVSRTVLQQVALMVALAATATAAVSELDVSSDTPGLAAWGVGLVWALLGWGGILAHSRFALAFGSATAIIGAMSTSGADAGTALTLVTVLAVVGSAMAVHDLVLLGVGTVGLMINVPAATTRWFPDSLAAAYGLLLMGLALVLVAVWIARRHTPEATAEASSELAARRAAPALAASALVLLVVVVIVAADVLR